MKKIREFLVIIQMICCRTKEEPGEGNINNGMKMGDICYAKKKRLKIPNPPLILTSRKRGGRLYT